MSGVEQEEDKVKLGWQNFGLDNGVSDEEQAVLSRGMPKWSHFADTLLGGIGQVYDRVPFRHLLPIFVLVLYTVFGGWLFRYLENDSNVPVSADVAGRNLDTTSIQPDLNTQLSFHRKEMTRRLWRLKLNNTTPKMRDRMVESVWAWYDTKRVDWCGKEEKSQSAWTMWNSMFYAATLYTTIGEYSDTDCYGHITPSTTAGRVATMVYALFGIPLVLTILNDWGTLLFNFLKFLHQQYTRFKHRKSTWVPLAGGPEEAVDLPVTVAVFLLIFWLCACAGIFLIWEDEWNYFTSFYFFFISLTTIGLGDVVPRYPQYTLMSFLLVLCGLSVVSMSFNVIQTKIENVFKSLMLRIEQEYWQKQVEPEKSQFGEGGGMSATMGVMQLWKKQPLKQRILFRLMDKSKKEMLQEYWEKKANTRNQSTQTIQKTFATESLQVDLDEEEAESKYRNRKYIYNLDD